LSIPFTTRLVTVGTSTTTVEGTSNRLVEAELQHQNFALEGRFVANAGDVELALETLRYAFDHASNQRAGSSLVGARLTLLTKGLDHDVAAFDGDADFRTMVELQLTLRALDRDLPIGDRDGHTTGNHDRLFADTGH
jgi:hypothetical protein